MERGRARFWLTHISLLSTYINIVRGHPQLVDHNVLTNMPKLMDIIIRVVKKLLPKRTTEKV